MRAGRARAFILLSAVAALAGCVSLAPRYERPASELPQAWSDAPAEGAAAPGERWWTLFDDAMLNALVDEALAHNQDLKIAAARVEEARGLYRTAQGLRWPALGASLHRDRTRFSQLSATPMPGTEDALDTRRATLDASYELDFFSRLRDASKAARAELLATRAGEATVRISLTAQVVQSYYALTALDAQVAATRRSLDLRVQDLDLQKVRYGAGLIGDFDLRRREAEVAAARAQLPVLERARAAEELALAVLLGRSPREIVDGKVELGAERGEPPAPMVPDALPSELLLRRPDLVQAEQRLIAANALVGAARAAFFPRIALSGYYGSESAALSDLFTGPAGTWQFAAGLTQPIFQGGRLFGELGAAHGVRAQALAGYQKSIQEAFRDVRLALITQARSREIFDAEGERLRALEETLRLARIRYDNGLSSQLELLDAERNLLAAELNRIDALRAQRAAVADLVKALGGGWGGGQAPAARAATQ